MPLVQMKIRYGQILIWRYSLNLPGCICNSIGNRLMITYIGQYSRKIQHVNIYPPKYSSTVVLYNAATGCSFAVLFCLSQTWQIGTCIYINDDKALTPTTTRRYRQYLCTDTDIYLSICLSNLCSTKSETMMNVALLSLHTADDSDVKHGAWRPPLTHYMLPPPPTPTGAGGRQQMTEAKRARPALIFITRTHRPQLAKHIPGPSHVAPRRLAHFRQAHTWLIHFN